MKNKYTLLFLFAAFCCLGVQCKEEKTEIEKLPPVSTYGANTFGCLVNGDAWPMGGVAGTHDFDFSYFDGITVLAYYINTSQFAFDEWVNLTTKRINAKGLYEVGYDVSTGEFFSAKFEGEYYGSGLKINKDLGRKAMVNILRLDTIKGIISGTLSFSLFNEKGTKEIHITNGRFDYNY